MRGKVTDEQELETLQWPADISERHARLEACSSAHFKSQLHSQVESQLHTGAIYGSMPKIIKTRVPVSTARCVLPNYVFDEFMVDAFSD